ncbi:hypothetical protein OEZ85_004784, partial [Tetradesmus obliquus]
MTTAEPGMSTPGMLELQPESQQPCSSSSTSQQCGSGCQHHMETRRKGKAANK